MAQLAIKGHPTRGKEVIKILEMLGGKSYTGLPYKGDDSDRYYYINKVDNYINSETICSTLFPPKKFQIFILEDFLAINPYKVGDKVIYTSEVFTIIGMKWDCNRDIVIYTMKNNCGIIDCYDSTWIKPYKEEIKEENKIFNEILDTLSSYLIDFMTPQGIDKCIKYIRENMDEYNKEELKEAIKIAIPKGYEFSEVNNQHVVFTKIQPKYPKTYEECIGQLPINWDGKVEGYESELLVDFQKLLIARDVYWKKAGEQLGLGKPWEPNWDDENEFKYGIYHFRNGIMYDGSCINPTLLAFPTAEIRDLFYKNFKNLIEKCKKLL